jgi:hypothetical protein
MMFSSCFFSESATTLLPEQDKPAPSFVFNPIYKNIGTSSKYRPPATRNPHGIAEMKGIFHAAQKGHRHI